MTACVRCGGTMRSTPFTMTNIIDNCDCGMRLYSTGYENSEVWQLQCKDVLITWYPKTNECRLDRTDIPLQNPVPMRLPFMIPYVITRENLDKYLVLL